MKVEIFDVGPRDGLQNEKVMLSVDDKIWLVQSLAEAGVTHQEAGAFVRPDKVPQMADSEEIAKHFSKTPSLIGAASLWYLVPNAKGLERAIACGVKNIALFTAVSDTFNKKNIGMSVDESFAQMKDLVTEARKHEMKVRGYVSTVWGCPFEGRIQPEQAILVLEKMLSLGVDQLSIGDTIGVAAPVGVKEILDPLIRAHGTKKLAVHFHDTRGTALANAFAAFEMGIRIFDSSIGGLGGCPFAPGAAGNLATEDLVYLFKEMGIDTGIDYLKLCETSVQLFKKMGKTTYSSKALQAYVANCSNNPVWDR